MLLYIYFTRIQRINKQTYKQTFYNRDTVRIQPGYSESGYSEGTVNVQQGYSEGTAGVQ